MYVTAPTGSPQSLSLTSAGRTSLSLTWQPVPCAGRGGQLTSYRIQTRVRESGQLVAEQSVSQESAEVHNLTPFTDYSIQVLMNNRQGAGPSQSLTARTSQAREYKLSQPLCPHYIKTCVTTEPGVLFTKQSKRSKNHIHIRIKDFLIFFKKKSLPTYKPKRTLPNF